MKIAIYSATAPAGLIPGDQHILDQVFPLMSSWAGESEPILLLDDELRALAPQWASGAGGRLTGLATGSALARWYATRVKARTFLRNHRPKLLLQLHNQLPAVPGALPRVFLNSDPYLDLQTLKPFPGLMVTDVALGSEAGSVTRIHRGILPGFEPAALPDRQEAWERYGSGGPYFLYAGALDQRALPVLKAFSLFKKRQKTDWKLVLTGSTRGAGSQGFMKSLAQYRYRDQLLILADPDPGTLRSVVNAAYGAVYLGGPSWYLLPELLHAGVPVIGVRDHYSVDVAGQEALFVETADPALIAGELMQLYRDEDGRAALVDRGRVRVSGYSWQQAAVELWPLLKNTSR